MKHCLSIAGEGGDRPQDFQFQLNFKARRKWRFSEANFQTKLHVEVASWWQRLVSSPQTDTRILIAGTGCRSVAAPKLPPSHQLLPCSCITSCWGTAGMVPGLASPAALFTVHSALLPPTVQFCIPQLQFRVRPTRISAWKTDALLHISKLSINHQKIPESSFSMSCFRPMFSYLWLVICVLLAQAACVRHACLRAPCVAWPLFSPSFSLSLSPLLFSPFLEAEPLYTWDFIWASSRQLHSCCNMSVCPKFPIGCSDNEMVGCAVIGWHRIYTT